MGVSVYCGKKVTPILANRAWTAHFDPKICSGSWLTGIFTAKDTVLNGSILDFKKISLNLFAVLTQVDTLQNGNVREKRLFPTEILFCLQSLV